MEKFTYKGKEILLLFLLQNGCYRLAARDEDGTGALLGLLASLTRVDACNPLLQAHPTWARDEHEGRGIPTSLTPVSGRLAPFPPSRSPTRSTHLGWGTRRHSLVGPRDPPISKRQQFSIIINESMIPLSTISHGGLPFLLVGNGSPLAY
jgi:hypothetical protein